MPEPRVSLGYTETLHPKMERRRIAWRFWPQGRERGEGKGWGGQGMTLELALFHVPSMAVLLDPLGREEGGCHPRGLSRGLSRSVLPTSLQVFLKEAAGNHPRSSGVSHASTGGPNTGAKAHSGAGWSRCSREPSCPSSIRVWLSSSVTVHPTLLPSTRGEG